MHDTCKYDTQTKPDAHRKKHEMSESITRIKAFNLVRTILNGMETQDDLDTHARLFATLTEEASCASIEIAKQIAAILNESFIQLAFYRAMDSNYTHQQCDEEYSAGE